jgi:hypothetical protein
MDVFLSLVISGVKVDVPFSNLRTSSQESRCGPKGSMLRVGQLGTSS